MSARVLVALVAMVAVVTGLVVSAPGAGAQEWSRTDIEAGRNLLAHVPADFRPGCEFEQVGAPGSKTTPIASVHCDLPSGLAADTLTYIWYETMEEADASFDQTSSVQQDALQPDGCGTYNGEYTIDDTDEGGRYTCVTSDGTTSIVYTYSPFPVVGVISAAHADEVDMDELGDFFDNDAGPLEDAGKIPSLQTQKFGKKAAKSLLGHIPSAIAKKCEANGDSFTSPWKAFEYGCIAPSGAAVRYTSYRDDVGYEAAYDADAFLDRFPAEAQAESCGEGTWTLDDEEAGSYICVVADGVNYMLWTDDALRIVGYATIDGSQMTADEFTEWWNDEAGPV